MKMKRTLYSSRRLNFNELTNAKKILCCILFLTDTAARRQASALAVVFENLGPPLSNVMQIIHMPCIVQEIQTYEIESIFFNHAVYLYICMEHVDFSSYLFLSSLNESLSPTFVALPRGFLCRFEIKHFQRIRDEVCKYCQSRRHNSGMLSPPLNYFLKFPIRQLQTFR